MRGLAYDPYLDAETVAARGAEQVEFNELLSRADFISLHLPLNGETRNLIRSEELGQMKKSAVLINTARGGIVDEKALEVALRNRDIAMAALDVFEREPLPADSPLTQLDNLIHTPHIAGQSAASLVQMSVQAGENIRTVLNGEKLDADFVVNPEALDRPASNASMV